MPFSLFRDSKSRGSPSASPKEDQHNHPFDSAEADAGGDCDGGGDAGRPASATFPPLKSSPLLAVGGGTSPHTTSCSTLPPTPRVSTTTAVLSPVSSPRNALPSFSSPTAQESVSVLVRLKGVTAATSTTTCHTSGTVNNNAYNTTSSSNNGSTSGIGVKPSSPASLTSSPRTVALLEYSVEDGTLRTPRTSRRAASRGSGPLTPQPPSELPSPGGTDAWQPGHATRTASQLVGEGKDGSPAGLTVTLPKALTSGGAATSPSAQALADSLPSTSVMPTHTPKLSAAAATTSPTHVRSASGCIGSKGRVLTIHAPNSDECRQYEFGDVLEPDASNAQVCERILPAVLEQLQAGYNVCVLCYGQTGSGKTYTMNALAPAISNEIFRTLDVLNEVVEMSYIQIYNNKAYNLLDTSRAGKLGAELSKPLQSTSFDSTSSGSSSPSGPAFAGSASEPKLLVRSAAEVVAKMRAAARMRVTHAHALNPRSSRSFTLLTLHVTRFLDGAPLTTTRVTLADLAGTERLKKSGATGEGQSQAIFINKSLMALRELVEAGAGDNEVLHYRDSLLTTYLAPRMRSWHLFLLVTVSLEAGNYEETKSSLEFATNARRRRIKKVRSRTADRLSGTWGRLYPGGGWLANTANAISSSNASSGCLDVAELQSVVETLQYRIRLLEDSLKLEQQQRSALEQLCSPLVSPRSGDGPLPLRDASNRGGEAKGEVEDLTGKEKDEEEKRAPPRDGGRDDRLRRSDALIHQLRHECRQYRQLLREREEDLRKVQARLSPEGGSAFLPASLHDTMSTPTGTHPTSIVPAAAATATTTTLPPPSLEGVAALDTQAGQDLFTPSLNSSFSASALSGDASADGARDAASSSTDDLEDAHAQLLQSVRHLRGRLSSDLDAESSLERLHNVVLRAKEQFEDVRERLLVVSTSLSGLRAQNHKLREDALRNSQDMVAHGSRLQRYAEALEEERLRAGAAEMAAEELRLHLFRAYAEQPIGEELTRLYMDEQPSTEVAETLSGTQLAEHREEMEKFELHQHALQDKITELVNTVEQLTRAGTQKDVSLATLEALITPAQRALFHTMSTTPSPSSATRADAEEADGAATVAAAETAADCQSLLQSRVAELQSLLTKERQQHQLTRCEVVEAREDARRSRQEQRQAFFQQQEEERRVAQLTSENYDLRRQNERHQLYLDQIHVHFQEQLLELRRYHQAEMAEQRRLFEETQQQQEQPQQPHQHSRRAESKEMSTSGFESSGHEDGEGSEKKGSRSFRETSTRRGASHGPLHASQDWTPGATARGLDGPSPQKHHHRTSSSAVAALDAPHRHSAGAAAPVHTEAAEASDADDNPIDAAADGAGGAALGQTKARRTAKTAVKKKSKGKSSSGPAAKKKATRPPPRPKVASRGSRRPSDRLNSTQPPGSPLVPVASRRA